MIRLIKLLFLLTNLLVFLLLDFFIGSKGGYPIRVVVHSCAFSILVYIFGGLEKKGTFSKNEIILSYGLSFLISTAFLLMYVAITSAPIGYVYLLITAVYSLAVLPFLIFYIYYHFFYRINPQRILIVGERSLWEDKMTDLLAHSLGRIEAIDFCSHDDIRKGFLSGTDNNDWNRVIAISPSDDLYRMMKDQNLFLISAGRYAERHLLKIPLDLIRGNEEHYAVSFEDVGVDPLVRVFDVLFSGLILLVASPFLMVAVLGILLFDRMPVFYRQERRGYRAKKILIYKLSTMKYNEQVGEAVVTPLGRILRILRLNEVPQLLNVVKGEMSLVGPRPDIESTYAYCMEHIRYYHYRTNVLPGITGHAQVHYKYVDRLDVDTFSERLSYDLYYVKNYSIYLYLITLTKTVGSILLLKGK